MSERIIALVSRPTVPKAFLLILVTASLVRGALLLIVLENPGQAMRRDSGQYLAIAVNLLEGNGYSDLREPPYRETAFITPTYPLFLAGAIFLFGENAGAVAAIQVLIDMTSVVLVYMVGKHLFSKPGALLGSLLYALSLAAITHSVFILTETLFTFLVLSTIGAVVLYRSSESKLWLLAAGILSGLVILCRPIAVLFPLIILLAIGLAYRGRWKTIVVTAALYLLLTVLTVTPWLIHNNRSLGTPTLSTLGNYNLLMYNASALEADRRGISQASARGELRREAELELAKYGWAGDEIRRLGFYGDWGREIIASDPGRYLFVHLKNDLNSLLPAAAEFLELLGVTEGAKGTLSVLNQHGIVAAVNHYFEGKTWLLLPFSPLILLLGLTYVGCVIGVIRLVAGRRWFVLAILLLPVLYFLLVVGPPANPRFRVPVMPYICLLAGMGLVFALGWLSSRWRKRFSNGAQ